MVNTREDLMFNNNVSFRVNSYKAKNKIRTLQKTVSVLFVLVVCEFVVIAAMLTAFLIITR